MPIGSGLRTRSIVNKKTFPDIKSAGGRYSGLLTGVQTAMYQGQVNQQNQMNDRILGMQAQRGQQTYDLANRRLNIEKLKARKTLGSKEIKWDVILNNANRQITTLNSKIATANANSKYPQALIPYMSLDDIMASRGKIKINQSMPIGSGLVPSNQPRNFWGKARDAFKAITGFAEGGIVNKPQMAMVGEQGKEYIVPEDKLNPDIKAQLEQILGAQGNNTSNGQPGANSVPSTEELIATLQDYGDNEADRAIDDLIALDQEINKPGIQLSDNIDYEAFAQAFIQKFGEEAYRKLEAKVTGKV